MKVYDVKEYIEVQVPYTYVVNMFHNETPDNCAVVLIQSSGNSTRNISGVGFQFLVRNVDPEQAETIAYQIYNHFDNKTDFVIGTSRVVFSRGQQTVPLYTGTDEKGRHIYSINIENILDK